MPQPRDNEWARAHGLDDRFVVMHSGNIGHAQNLDALVRAATFLRDLDDLAIVLVGDGARRARARRAGRDARAPTRVRFLTVPAARGAAALALVGATSTSSGSRAGCPATSCRAGSTGSSPSAGR